jgi:uncharacterized protein (TIGR00725 family)
MNISVFGGSKTPVDSPDYRAALALGRGLAGAGHAILTGGYGGSMEAVSRGAAEAGGEVVGVTCLEIESWRPVRPNRWLTREVKHATLNQRLLDLVTRCDLAVALPGGVGTLTEVAMAWNLMVVAVNPPRPILLVGAGWEDTFQSFYRGLDAYIPAPDRRLLVFCPDVPAALEYVHACPPAAA